MAERRNRQAVPTPLKIKIYLILMRLSRVTIYLYHFAVCCVHTVAKTIGIYAVRLSVVVLSALVVGC
jgi:hypothetical protein